MENNNQQSFWQFSDQLRVQNLANLSLNDSIWSTNSVYKRNDDRRNFDIAADKNPIEYNNNKNKTPPPSDKNNADWWNWKSGGSVLNNKNSDLGGFGPVGSKSSTFNLNPTDTWKFNNNNNKSVNGDFNKGIYSSPAKSYGYNVNLKNKGIIDEEQHQILPKNNNGKKNRKNQNHNHNHRNGNNEDDKNGGGLDKRFKTLPPAEALPRNETIGGYIFVCNNDTMEENLKRQLFGLPPRYRDSVRAITPGLPLFLYNYSTHQLHGIYQVSFFFLFDIIISTQLVNTCWD